jgi:hypothetical protein
LAVPWGGGVSDGGPTDIDRPGTGRTRPRWPPAPRRSGRAWGPAGCRSKEGVRVSQRSIHMRPCPFASPWPHRSVSVSVLDVDPEHELAGVELAARRHRAPISPEPAPHLLLLPRPLRHRRRGLDLRYKHRGGGRARGGHSCGRCRGRVLGLGDGLLRVGGRVISGVPQVRLGRFRWAAGLVRSPPHRVVHGVVPALVRLSTGGRRVVDVEGRILSGIPRRPLGPGPFLADMLSRGLLRGRPSRLTRRS